MLIHSTRFHSMISLIRFLPIFSLLVIPTLSWAEDRIPFYEDFLKDSDFDGFLQEAQSFLKSKADAIEAPRLALDLLMASQIAKDSDAYQTATSLLLFKYPNSLPTLHYLSSFEPGSERLIEILKDKAEKGDLRDKGFANAYCRAIILAARSQGPELLKDSSLRLMTYLLALKAEVEEIQTSTIQSLEKEKEGNGVFNKVVAIVLDETEPIEKLKALAPLSGTDAQFCLAYYVAQLDEAEASSPEVTDLKIIQSLFRQNPNTTEVKELISGLPQDIRKSSRIQTLLALAQHIEGDTEEAIKTLGELSNSKDPWTSKGESYANGLEFMENRSKLLLESLNKAFDKIDDDKEALYAKVSWTGSGGDSKIKKFEAHMGISLKNQSVEFQFFGNDELYVAYKTSTNNSLLITPGAKEIVSFAGPGAIPIPSFSINRDISTGVFNFSFNLNFASSTSFDKLIKEGENLLDNPYLGTSKGREVLINYLLRQKGGWLLAPQTIDSGITYPMRIIDPNSAEPTKTALSFDLSNQLTSISVGKFSLTSLQLGENSILGQMPDLPDLPEKKMEKFDFNLFLKILNEASNLGKG